MSTYDLKKLNPRHFKMLEFCLRGWTNKQIADHLDMTSGNVSIVVNSSSFQHELATRRSTIDDLSNQQIVESDQDVTDAIRESTMEAVERIVGCIHSDDENVAIRASTEMLDRGGFPKVSKIESKNLSVVMDANMMKIMKETIAMDKD